MATVDPARCPLCGESNTCGIAAGQATCWCFEVEVMAETLTRIPTEAQGVACVCPRCAQLGSTPATEPPRRDD